MVPLPKSNRVLCRPVAAFNISNAALGFLYGVAERVCSIWVVMVVHSGYPPAEGRLAGASVPLI